MQPSQSPDTDLKLEVLTPQRLFQYKKRLAEANSAKARGLFADEAGEGSADRDPSLLAPPPLSPNARGSFAIPDTIQETSEDRKSPPSSSLRPPPTSSSRPPSRNRLSASSSPVPPAHDPAQRRQTFSAFREATTAAVAVFKSISSEFFIVTRLHLTPS